VDENLRVALVFAVDFLSGFNVHDDDVLRPNLFEAEAVRLHEDAILAGNAKRDVAQYIVPMTFDSENIARVRQLFFELFDVRGHGFSLDG
jgi:hypothetical protein